MYDNDAWIDVEPGAGMCFPGYLPAIAQLHARVTCSSFKV
jgi:hypothetical protein